MSQVIIPAVSSALVNPNNEYASIGYGTGPGTAVTSGGTNTKGTPVSLGTAPADLAGFFLDIGMASSASSRFAIDLSFDNSATWAVQNIYSMPGTSGSYSRVFLPLNMPNGAQITARVASSVAAASINLAIAGIRRNAASPPMFNAVTTLNFDTATTRPAAPDILLTNTYVELVTTTAADYGALIGILADSTALPTTAQGCSAALALGTAGNEVELARWGMQLSTSNPTIRNSDSIPIYHTIPAGTRISTRALAATTGDALRQVLYAFGS